MWGADEFTHNMSHVYCHLTHYNVVSSIRRLHCLTLFNVTFCSKSDHLLLLLHWSPSWLAGCSLVLHHRILHSANRILLKLRSDYSGPAQTRCMAPLLMLLKDLPTATSQSVPICKMKQNDKCLENLETYHPCSCFWAFLHLSLLLNYHSPPVFSDKALHGLCSRLRLCLHFLHFVQCTVVYWPWYSSQTSSLFLSHALYLSSFLGLGYIPPFIRFPFLSVSPLRRAFLITCFIATFCP